MVCMTSSEKIISTDLENLKIVKYPDPRLREMCTPVETVDEHVKALVEKMADMMFESNGVGLAAPQVGVTVQIFIGSPTFERDDLHVYINPKIVAVDGAETIEEGCLSFPGIFSKIKRYATVTIEATNLAGEVFTQTCQGLHARICQHENDHLEGRLLVDRMGSVSKTRPSQGTADTCG